MPNDILSTLIQATGAAGVSGAFIYYLIKRDKRDAEMMERFNATIQKHMSEATVTMQELKDVIQKLYEQNWKLVKRDSEKGNSTLRA